MSMSSSSSASYASCRNLDSMSTISYDAPSLRESSSSSSSFGSYADARSMAASSAAALVTPSACAARVPRTPHPVSVFSLQQRLSATETAAVEYLLEIGTLDDASIEERGACFGFSADDLRSLEQQGCVDFVDSTWFLTSACVECIMSGQSLPRVKERGFSQTEQSAVDFLLDIGTLDDAAVAEKGACFGFTADDLESLKRRECVDFVDSTWFLTSACVESIMAGEFDDEEENEEEPASPARCIPNILLDRSVWSLQQHPEAESATRAIFSAESVVCEFSPELDSVEQLRKSVSQLKIQSKSVETPVHASGAPSAPPSSAKPSTGRRRRRRLYRADANQLLQGCADKENSGTPRSARGKGKGKGRIDSVRNILEIRSTNAAVPKLKAGTSLFGVRSSRRKR